MFIAIGALHLSGEDGEPLRDAENHLVGEAAIGTIAVSEDGRDWEVVYSGGPIKDGFNHARNNLVRAMAYGNGKLVCALNGGNTLTSTDGRNWEEHARGDREPGPSSMNLIFADGRFVSGGAGSFAHSKDGITWQSFSLHDQVKAINGVGVWGWEGAGHIRKTLHKGEMFAIYGERRFGTSPDAQTLDPSHHVLPAGDRWERGDMITAQGKFIWMGGKAYPAVGLPAEHAFSTDGKTWQPFVIGDAEPETIKSQRAIVWTGDQFVVSGRRCVYHSPDLENWSRVSSDGDRVDQMECAHGDLILSSQGWARVFEISSDGGATWEKVDWPANMGCRRVYYWTGDALFGQKSG